MKERRKRLLRLQQKSTVTRESAQNNFAAYYTDLISKKREILAKFDSAKIEAALKDSTKSTALELVMTLLPQAARHGILVDLEVCFGIKVDPESPSYT